MLAFEFGSLLENLEDQVFEKCDGLRSICIPASVRTLPRFCFDYCHSLEALTFESSSKLTKIEIGALRGCRSLQSIELPEFAGQIDGSVFGRLFISHIAVSPQNPYLKVDEHCLVNIADATVCWWFGNETDFIIPEYIESLGRNCCAGSNSLERIRFRSSAIVTVIGDEAFESCESLKSIHIPAPVRVIGLSCFEGCQSLSRVTFESGSALQTIQQCAFRSCVSLHSICIPSSVRVIGQLCFANCTALVAFEFEANAQIDTMRHGSSRIASR
jgi:hypothetical protein